MFMIVLQVFFGIGRIIADATQKYLESNKMFDKEFRGFSFQSKEN